MLVAAHRARIIHRDLKPSNVMLTRAGVKLMDFGIAKRRDPVRQSGVTVGPDATATAFATLSGSLVGTVPYMAPEQLEGGPIDARTDIFGFGALLFEMATGNPAFSGSSTVFACGGYPRRNTPSRRCKVGRTYRARRIASSLSAWPAIPTAGGRTRPICCVNFAGPKTTCSRAIPRRSSSPGKKWLIHTYWGAAVFALVAALTVRRCRQTETPSPPPNPQPVIVLMDSPLQGRVYDPQTLKEGGTNADDITDALRALSVAIRKENTSAVWHRLELAAFRPLAGNPVAVAPGIRENTRIGSGLTQGADP